MKKGLSQDGVIGLQNYQYLFSNTGHLNQVKNVLKVNFKKKVSLQLEYSDIYYSKIPSIFITGQYM